MLIGGYSLFACGLDGSFLELPREGDTEEAGLLFTSGSSGDPKGVVLSHRNILSNCEQISSVGLITKNEQVLANLPVFHSFRIYGDFVVPDSDGLPDCELAVSAGSEESGGGNS